MHIGLTDIIYAMLKNAPILVAWLTGIVLAVIMLKRGGGKPEIFLLVACCLMFVMQLFRPFVDPFYRWMRDAGNINIGLTPVQMTYSAVLIVPAVVLLVCAFWMKFWKRREANA